MRFILTESCFEYGEDELTNKHFLVLFMHTYKIKVEEQNLFLSIGRF